jgi:type I restriction enzyme M protein
MSEVQSSPDPFKLFDVLRSEPIRISESIVALAALIYLRWVDFQEAEAEAMAAFDDSEHVPALPPAFHWRRWCMLPPPELKSLFANEIPSGIERVGRSHEPWAGPLLRILPAIRSLSNLSVRAIDYLVHWLAEQPFETPSDRRRLLVVFDVFLDRASEREFGQFRTPSDITELMVALAAPGNGQRIYDPCCGTGGFLSAAWDAVQKTGKDKFIRPEEESLEVAGVDINLDAFVIALARLVLAGVPNPQLELGNSLEREGFGNPAKEGFDLVISNPPWGAKIDPYGIHHFPIPTNDGTSLFVQHAISQLRPSGRAVLVVPQGFLFQQGKTANVRQWLLERHGVEAVIGLPEGAFQPYTGIRAAVLILHRDAGPTQSVRMMDGSEFFDPRKGKDPAWIPSHQIAALRNALVHSGNSKVAWDVPAATLAELDFDFSPTRREVSALEQALESLDVPIRPLKELCDVIAGRSAKSSDLSDAPMGESPVPFIRTGDIQRGQTMKNTSWLSEEAVAGFGPRYRLRAGDVLLSKAGTIGKAGIVRNGAVGGIASGTLFVLTHISKQLDPHFLTAYLMSRDCQEWLQSRSSGSVISGLRKQFVEELKVPIPPLPIQERVAIDVRNHQVDALTQLVQFLTQDESDPIANWIDRSLKALSVTVEKAETDPSAVVRFQIFGSDFSDVLAWAMPDDDPPPLMAWALNLVNVAELFRGSDEVPQGPALLSMLQTGIDKLAFAAGQIEGHSPLEGKARELTKACIKRLETAIDELFSNLHVTLSPQTSTLNAGTSQDVSFLVKNEGPLPLRNFTIDGTSWVFGGVTIFLPERSERVMTAEVKVPDNPGRHVIKGEWFGKTMDGRQVQGEQEFVFEIIAQSEGAKESFDLGPSPYFHGPPVGPDRNDVFFGRDSLLQRIKNQIQGGNTVLLEGNRRSGKSSILRHLEGKDTIPGWIAVFADFQSAEGDKTKAGMPSEAVWRSLAGAIVKGLAPLKIDLPLPNGGILKAGSLLGYMKACREGIGESAPWEDFLEYFQTILMTLDGLNLGLVLMIDEFDKLQEGIDNGVTSPQIPENIRYLIQAHPRFAAVMTGSRRMQRLRHEYWSALYGLGNQIPVTALDPESARELITEPVEGRLNYTNEAVDFVIHLTARQPFLIQYLCNRIFELATHEKSRSISRNLVEEAARLFVRDNEHFASLWDYAETYRRRLIVAICHKFSVGPDPVTFGFLQEQLANEHIEVTDAELDQDLKFLQELELIDFKGADSGGVYQLTVPLMGQWLDQQQDYQALRSNAILEQDL